MTKRTRLDHRQRIDSFASYEKLKKLHYLSIVSSSVHSSILQSGVTPEVAKHEKRSEQWVGERGDETEGRGEEGREKIRNANLLLPRRWHRAIATLPPEMFVRSRFCFAGILAPFLHVYTRDHCPGAYGSRDGVHAR